MSTLLVKSNPEVTCTDTIVNLAYTAQYVEDPEGRITIETLLGQPDMFQFKQVSKQTISFGLTSSYYWIRLTLMDQTANRLHVQIASNPLTDIKFYETKGLHVLQQYHTGNWQSFNKRPVKHIDYIFPLEVAKGASTTVYIRVMHLRGTQFPLYAGPLKAFYEADSTRILINGIYYGLILLMVMYNLFIYYSLKDKSYLFYVAYVFLIALLNASMDGYAFQYFWPSLPAINQYEDIFASLVGIAAILFVISFLNTKANASLLHRILIGLAVAYIVTIAIIASKHFMIGSSIMEIVSLASVISIFITALVILKKGFRPAKFFLVAWTMLLVSIIVFILKDFNLLPYNQLTVNSFRFGSGVEAVLLSIALADRIKLFRNEKARAQLERIQSLQEKATMQHEMIELEARALRSQMNPHFIFNCLNSIKGLIQKKEGHKAITYLTTFSKLLRTILQNMDKREITLYDEIEICRVYTQLECMRFGNKFAYSFSVDPKLDIKSIQVPALILQPFIENAIWHGLMPKKEAGYLTLSVEIRDGIVACIIDDNGIGRKHSALHKIKHHASDHQSKGVTLSQSRLNLDNSLNKRNATVETIDKLDEHCDAAGTTVILSFKEY
ncbi:MAG: 7TM diverse intracellular signaling domain-containing protein [Ferruginibacter sp.]